MIFGIFLHFSRTLIFTFKSLACRGGCLEACLSLAFLKSHPLPERCVLTSDQHIESLGAKLPGAEHIIIIFVIKIGYFDVIFEIKGEA